MSAADQLSGLPTRAEMLRRTLADLDRARNALSDARDWVMADWRPVESSLTDDQADARTATLKAVVGCKDEIDRAKGAIHQALSAEAAVR